MQLPFILASMNEPAATDQAADVSRPKRVARYVPLIIWLGFISFASTDDFSADNTSRFIRPLLRWLFPKRSEAELDGLHFLVRKAGHFIEYAVLAFLARWAFAASSSRFIQRRWFELALLLVVLNSLVDELHQSFVPSRTGSIYDTMIDIAGGLTVLLIFKIYDRRRIRRANC